MIRTRLVPMAVFALAAAIPLRASDIEGQVRSTVRSAVFSSAVVQIREQGLIRQEILVDSTGRFEFRNVNVGSYVVRVHAEGFADRDEPVLILKNNSKEYIQIEVVPDTSRQKAEEQNRNSGVVSVYNLNIPDSARREYEQGLKERDKGGCSKALPHFEKAIGAFGNYADALNEVGKCYREAAKLDRAEDAFRKAIQYGSSIFPYINLADVLVSRKQFEESQTILHEGIAKYPAAGDLFFALANSLFGQGLMKEAEEAALAAHSRSHASADVHLLLAKIYLNGGRYPDVTNQLKTYLNENPKGALADRVRQNLDQLERK